MFNRPSHTPLESFENAQGIYYSFCQYYSGSPNAAHANTLKKDYDNMVAAYNRLSEEEKQKVILPNYEGVPKVMTLGDISPFRNAPGK